MDIVVKNSLAKTVDNIDELLFLRKKINRTDISKATHFILGRTNKPGSYENMPAPTEYDFKNGLKLFTGEKVTSNAGIAHILGHEALRTAYILTTDMPNLRKEVESATNFIVRRIKDAPKQQRLNGLYCCSTCSCALWRHIAAGNMLGCKKMLKFGIKHLADSQDSKGRWKGFPFYYTLLVLSESVISPATVQLRYAYAKTLNRSLTGIKGADKYSKRRKMLLQKIINKLDNRKYNRRNSKQER
jgi:hypothetical protein